jgi:hypothetical protein
MPVLLRLDKFSAFNFWRVYLHHQVGVTCQLVQLPLSTAQGLDEVVR